jgi:hypothetical protein
MDTVITLLQTLASGDALRLLVTLTLMIGPGLALSGLLRHPRQQGVIQFAATTGAFTVACWPLFSLWFSTLSLRWHSVLFITVALAGWAIAVALFIRNRSWRSLYPSRGSVLLLTMLIGHALLSLAALRGLYAGPGIDSYHHTLVSQLFVDQAGLPDNYAPYAPLVTFRYHFGFHSLTGAVSMLSGIPVMVLTPVLGQLAQTGAMLSLAGFALTLSGRARVAALAILLAGFVSPLPAAVANWARYPQLTGMIVLPVLLSYIWVWLRDGAPRRVIVASALFAAGLGLVHYRVSLFAGIGIASACLIWLWAEPARRVRMLSGLAVLIALTALLYAPWPARLIATRYTGVGFTLSAIESAGAAFFDIGRLGPWVLNHPALPALLALTAVAAVLAVVRRTRTELWLLAWSVMAVVASSPYVLSEYMDTVSVAISLYAPLAVLIAISINDLIDRAPQTRVLAHALERTAAAVGVLAALSLAPTQLGVVEHGNTWVRPDDIRAARWIQQNTPADARFAGSVFAFDYSPKWVLASDSAYWLPLTAQRQSSILPMIYDIEKAANAEPDSRMASLLAMGNNFATETAARALKTAGVTYLFVGERPGGIDVSALAHSPHYTLVFESGRVRVFQLR